MNPSILITPNAKKVGKLYSIIPTDGAGDLDVVRATTATYVGADGLIKTALANEVRFDYSNGSCPSILVEPQRTNLNLYSEDFNNPYWFKSLGTLTSNNTIAPNDTITADLFTKTSGINTVSQISSPNLVYATTGIHTLSVHLKPNVGNVVLLRLDNSGNTANFTFNFTTKTFTNSGVNVISSSYEELKDGWLRLKVTGNVTSTSWVVTPCNLFTNPTGDAMWVWGAQLEAGSNATSYIPTTTTAVTRNADVISKSGISSLIGQTEGTIFVDFNFTKQTDVYKRIIALSDSTSNNRIVIAINTAMKLDFIIIKDSIIQVFSLTNNGLVNNSINKIAIGYSVNNTVLYLNGNLVVSDLLCDIPNCSALYLGKDETSSSTSFLNDGINSAMIFKTRLTNTELQQLTTL